jgi:hypothetical protein
VGERATPPALLAAVSACSSLRDPMRTAKPWGREILRDLTTDSFVGPGDQGDGFVLHSNLFFASSSHQFLIEFLKSRIILTINSNPHAGSH